MRCIRPNGSEYIINARGQVILEHCSECQTEFIAATLAEVSAMHKEKHGDNEESSEDNGNDEVG